MVTKRIVKKKLGELKAWPDNPQVMDEQTFKALDESIKEFGYLDERLIINAEDEIIGGNHRWMKLRQLFGDGFEIECVELSDLDRIKQKKLNIILNNVKGDFDFNVLTKVLKELDEANIDFTGLGFSPQDLQLMNLNIKQDLLKDLDLLKETTGDKLHIKNEIKMIECPKCHEKFEYNPRAGRADIVGKIY